MFCTPGISFCLTAALAQASTISQSGRPGTGGKMPAKKTSPSGELRVLNQQTSDVTAGLSFQPLDAEQIRYLWVSGIIQIGTVEAAYDFTLIEYKLHLDETPCIIY